MHPQATLPPNLEKQPVRFHLPPEDEDSANDNNSPTSLSLAPLPVDNHPILRSMPPPPTSSPLVPGSSASSSSSSSMANPLLRGMGDEDEKSVFFHRNPDLDDDGYLTPDALARELADFGDDVPEYWKGLRWKPPQNGVMTSDLPHDHDEFKRISRYIDGGLEQHPYTSQQKENTRMTATRKRLNEAQAYVDGGSGKNDASSSSSAAAPARPAGAAEDWDPKLWIDRAQARLHEGDTGGAPRLSSGAVDISNVQVIANKALWQQYAAKKQALQKELAGNKDKNPLAKVQWSTNSKDAVLDDSVGEANLLHGTSSSVLDIIQQKGFAPDINKGQTKTSCFSGEKQQWGLLGQGTYFSDNMAKPMTYATCPRCGDYACDCGRDS